MVKTCSKCKVEKDESEFYKDKNKKDGVKPNCKSCEKVRKIKDVIPDGYSKCTKCGAVKEDVEFPKNRGQCKTCRAAYKATYNEDNKAEIKVKNAIRYEDNNCLLYTSPSPRDGLLSRMPSSA